jgi:glycosyltransferase involved in cell wall biosynthesis
MLLVYNALLFAMSYFPVTHSPVARNTNTKYKTQAPENNSMKESNKLRIALLGYRSHPHVGGQGIYLQYLSKALVDLGHAVDVISGPPYPELDSRVNLITIPSLDLYAHPHPTRALRFKHLLSFTDFYEWWSKLSGAFGEPYCFGRRLVAYFKQYKPQYDIVHDNQSLCYGLLDLQKIGMTLIATIHHPITRDRELAVAAAKNSGERWLVRRWYSFIDMQQKVVNHLQHLVTVSLQSKKDIVSAFTVSAEKIAVIPNGVDTELFKPLLQIPQTPFRLITTASSDQPLKGLSILLRALAALHFEFSSIHLVVIGQLNSGGQTEQELKNLGLEKSVNFISGISHQQLVEEYARASIAVVPSLYEGFGLPAAEALACGMPLVCSDGGALPEVVGDAALLVKAGDVQELTKAIKALLLDKQLIKNYQQKARTHALQQLSWDKVGKSMENYYYRVINQSVKESYDEVHTRISLQEIDNAHS